MTEAVEQQLIDELGFSPALAKAFVEAAGRCSYCKADLLMSRIGYAMAEMDHLLPKKTHPDLAMHPRNTVLSCRVCNGVKGHLDILKQKECRETMLNEGRSTLIARAREAIQRRMATYDADWRKATEILHGTWWQSDT